MMIKSPEEIIKEAELEIQQNNLTVLEKKASDVVDEIMSQRKPTFISKVAAFDFKSLATNFTANKGLRNAVVGAAGGAVAGAVANKDDIAGGAIKGGLLGGAIGGAGSLISPKTIKSFSSKFESKPKEKEKLMGMGEYLKKKVKSWKIKPKVTFSDFNGGE